MYRYKSNTLVVLGDPIGDPNTFESLLEKFYQFAEYRGYNIIFYQISDHATLSQFWKSIFQIGRGSNY